MKELEINLQTKAETDTETPDTDREIEWVEAPVEPAEPYREAPSPIPVRPRSPEEIPIRGPHRWGE